MREVSYGIVPLRKRSSDVWELLLVAPHYGYWGLPKGHPEKGESPEETARRELFEETGLSVKQFLSEIPFRESYSFHHASKLIHKRVEYFVAEVEGEVLLQPEEIQACRWIELSKAVDHATYPETKRIIREVLTMVHEKAK